MSDSRRCSRNEAVELQDSRDDLRLRVILRGRMVAAAEARAMGLVTAVVPDGALGERATALAERIARHPRAGLAASKSAVAEIRAGRPGGEARAYPVALREDPETRARLAAFIAGGAGRV